MVVVVVAVRRDGEARVLLQRKNAPGTLLFFRRRCSPLFVASAPPPLVRVLLAPRRRERKPALECTVATLERRPRSENRTRKNQQQQPAGRKCSLCAQASEIKEANRFERGKQIR